MCLFYIYIMYQLTIQQIANLWKKRKMSQKLGENPEELGGRVLQNKGKLRLTLGGLGGIMEEL